MGGIGSFTERLRDRAQALKREVVAIGCACRHPETPWYAKALAACVVAYALCPIDLIPDFVPILGYLDDLVLIPAGIALVVRLIPAEVLETCRNETEVPTSAGGRTAAVLIVLVWIAIGFLVVRLVFRSFTR
jgi:uncharacterized membrane protein YkvA (DUF1232 family)